MDTPEIIVYLLVAVITGALLLGVLGHLNPSGIATTVTSLLHRSPTSAYATVNAENLTPLLFHVWEDCNQGMTPKTLTFQYQGSPLSAHDIATPLINQHLCGTLSLTSCDCGRRDDITFGTTRVYDCNAPALSYGKVYTATCNTTTHTLDIDASPQACNDDRTDSHVCHDTHATCGTTTDRCGNQRHCHDERDDNTVCHDARLRCGTTTDECGLPRQCTACTECDTNADCTTTPNTTCCAHHCTDTITDNNNCGTCGNACTPTTCENSQCTAPPPPFMIALAQDKTLSLASGHLDWTTGAPANTGFTLPPTVLHSPHRLVTGQSVIPQTCIGSCETHYAVAFTLDDPLNPVVDTSVSINRVTGDYSQCHGDNRYTSFAASSSMAYQIATSEGPSHCGPVSAVIPPGHDYDISWSSIVYGIAENGPDAFAVLNDDLVYLNGITAIPNPPVGDPAHCAIGPGYDVCLRTLYHLTPPPASTPHLPSDPTAVSGDNIIVLEDTQIPTRGPDLSAPQNLSLYALQAPDPIQTVTLPPDITNTIADTEYTIYVRTLPQGTFVILEEWGGLPSVPAPHHLQVFKLTGTGINARLESATPLLVLPDHGYMSTLVSIKNEPVIIDFSRNSTLTLSVHAYLLKELSANPGAPRDAFHNPPAFSPTDTLHPDVSHSAASDNKDNDAYLYLLLDNGNTRDHHAWKLIKE